MLHSLPRVKHLQKLRFLQVEIAPPRRKNFAATKSHGERDSEEGLMSMADQIGQKCLRLNGA